jgi:hypothetical protein
MRDMLRDDAVKELECQLADTAAWRRHCECLQQLQATLIYRSTYTSPPLETAFRSQTA